MALYYDLPVFKDVYTLILKIFEYTKDFPHEYKHSLGQDMKRDSIQLVRSIYRANKAKDKVVYTTNTGTNGSVAQGVQQPFEISNVTGLEEANNISLIVSVYPNPTTDFLILEIEGDVKTQYFVSLYDMQGKLLQNKKITSHQTIIAMGNLVPAIYFLKVIKTQGHASQQEVKTFKIIKN
jgi:hypothetical protein